MAALPLDMLRLSFEIEHAPGMGHFKAGADGGI